MPSTPLRPTLHRRPSPRASPTLGARGETEPRLVLHGPAPAPAGPPRPDACERPGSVYPPNLRDVRDPLPSEAGQERRRTDPTRPVPSFRSQGWGGPRLVRRDRQGPRALPSRQSSRQTVVIPSTDREIGTDRTGPSSAPTIKVLWTTKLDCGQSVHSRPEDGRRGTPSRPRRGTGPCPGSHDSYRQLLGRLPDGWPTCPSSSPV